MGWFTQILCYGPRWSPFLKLEYLQSVSYMNIYFEVEGVFIPYTYHGGTYETQGTFQDHSKAEFWFPTALAADLCTLLLFHAAFAKEILSDELSLGSMEFITGP